MPCPTTQSPSAPQRQASLGGCAAALRRTHVILRSLVAVHVGAPRRHSARRRVRVRIQPPPRCSGRSLSLHYTASIRSSPLPTEGGNGAEGSAVLCGWPQLRTEREAEPAHHRRVSTARTPPLRSRTHARTESPSRPCLRCLWRRRLTRAPSDCRPIATHWSAWLGVLSSHCSASGCLPVVEEHRRIEIEFACSGARARRTGRRRAFDRAGVADPNADRRRSKHRHPPS